MIILTMMTMTMAMAMIMAMKLTVMMTMTMTMTMPTTTMNIAAMLLRDKDVSGDKIFRHNDADCGGDDKITWRGLESRV